MTLRYCARETALQTEQSEQNWRGIPGTLSAVIAMQYQFRKSERRSLLCLLQLRDDTYLQNQGNPNTVVFAGPKSKPHDQRLNVLNDRIFLDEAQREGRTNLHAVSSSENSLPWRVPHAGKAAAKTHKGIGFYLFCEIRSGEEYPRL